MRNNTSIQMTAELTSAIKTIKTAILQSQYRAAKSVNREQWSVLTNRQPTAVELQFMANEAVLRNIRR